MKGNKNIFRKSILGILFVAGAVSVPLMTDYCFCGDNLAAVLGKIEAMSRGLGHVFPVRFEVLELQDYGYYGASFQSNAVYLFPALFRLIGMDVGDAYKWSLFLLNLLTAFIAWISFYNITDRRDIGLVGSMLYTWCPYRCSEMYQMGNLEEVAGWTFLPMVFLGLWRLYQKHDNEEEQGASWVMLTAGLCLAALSSTVVLSVMIVFIIFILVLMDRETLKRRVLAKVGMAFGVFLIISAWFLIPMLLRMRNMQTVEAMILPDYRSYGVYLAQYITFFPREGGQIQTLQYGMKQAQAIGPGIAVVIALVFFLGKMFAGEDEKGLSENKTLTAGKLLGVSIVMLLLSSHLFPWDMLQDKNRLCSFVLALLCTPAKLGIAADAGMILTACLVLKELQENKEEREMSILLLAVMLISFGTMQFQLGNILTTQDFMRQEDLFLLSQTPISLIEEESFIWRCSEGISVVAGCICIALWIVRRHKDVKRIRVSQE